MNLFDAVRDAHPLPESTTDDSVHGEGFDQLVTMLYQDLRRVARGQLRRLRPGQTIDTTSLVN